MSLFITAVSRRFIVRSKIMRRFNSNSAYDSANNKIANDTSLNMPEEASLFGFDLVNKRAANMIFSIYGEREMTKLLQINSSSKFVESLGRQNKYDISVWAGSDSLESELKNRKEYKSVQTKQDAPSELMTVLPYRAQSFECALYLIPPEYDTRSPAINESQVPLSDVVNALNVSGYFIFGARTDLFKKLGLLRQIMTMSSVGSAELTSLQIIHCGVDNNPFLDFPAKANFKDDKQLLEEYGEWKVIGNSAVGNGLVNTELEEEIQQMESVLEDDPVSKPYCLVLIRKK